MHGIRSASARSLCVNCAVVCEQNVSTERSMQTVPHTIDHSATDTSTQCVWQRESETHTLERLIHKHSSLECA